MSGALISAIQPLQLQLKSNHVHRWGQNSKKWWQAMTMSSMPWLR